MSASLKSNKEFTAPGFFVEWQVDEFSPVKSSPARKVLLVAAEPATRERLGGWLASEGHDVIECPGPTAPEYTCIGSRGGDCPLAKAADVVVLDLHLDSDAAMTGTPSWQLVDYYVGRGNPVIAITGLDQMGRFFLDDRVTTLERPIERRTLLKAVERVTHKRSSVVEIGTFRWTPRETRSRRRMVGH